MAIPVSTTTITIQRTNTEETPNIDPWGSGYGTSSDGTEEFSTLATGVRAVISPSSGRSGQPGDTEVTEFKLVSDPTDLTYLDRVKDEFDQTTYEVVWSITTPGVAGLGHTAAGLRAIFGLGHPREETP